MRTKRSRGISVLLTLVLIAVNFLGMGSPKVAWAEGSGTWDNPYSVAQAVAIQDNRIASVQGYVVGQPTAATTVITSNFPNDYAIALADSPGERDTTKMIYVQLPAGTFRTTLGLYTNPGNMGCLVRVTGNLTPYFTPHPGVKSITAGEKINPSSQSSVITKNINPLTIYVGDPELSFKPEDLFSDTNSQAVITLSSPVASQPGVVSATITTAGTLSIAADPGVTGPNSVTLSVTGTDNFGASAKTSLNVTVNPADNVPPLISHTPVTAATTQSNLTINAAVSDNNTVAGVKLYYRTVGDAAYKSLNMTLAGGVYSAVIPQADLSVNGIEYYLEATDGKNTATSPTDITKPYQVAVSDGDLTPPNIVNLTPADGEFVITTKPEISAEYSDASGIDTGSITLTLDGSDVTQQAVISESKITFTPGSDLGKTTHSVALQVKDKSGSAQPARVSWSFTVGDYNFYFGNLHSHTNYSDGSGTPDDAYTWARDNAKIDFLAITDHSNWFDSDLDYTKSSKWAGLRQTADNYNQPGKFVAIGAFEMTWSGSTGGWGHINTFNTDWFESRNNSKMDLKTYYAKLAQYPQSISQLNHPGTTFGDFADFNYYTPEADKVVNLIEVGNGEGAVGTSGYFPSYDYYTRALDKGWHLAPTNNQDNHLGKWGNANTARTVILSPSLTREDLYAAMQAKRVYASEDSNLQIKYTVNGKTMGSTLTNPGKLSFSIAALDPDTAESIGKISLIANGGKVVATQDFTSNSAVWNFELDPQYTYYYVRIDGADNEIAVTAPVWTGNVTPAGISKVEVSQDPQVVNAPVDITATMYNNGTTTLSTPKIEFFKDSISPDSKLGEQVLGDVAPSSSASAKITWTPSQTGTYRLYAQSVINIGGTDKVVSESTTLQVVNPSEITKIVIDGGHQNQYVTGSYPGKIATLTSMLKAKKFMLVQNNDELTAADLENTKVLILTDPQSKDDTRNNLTKSNYSDAEIQVIKDFVIQGGSLIITSRADYDDKGVLDPTYQSSAQGNRVLAAVGSNLRFNDDEVIDDVSNGGQNYRLYFDDYTGSQYGLTANIPPGQVYSAYSGCSVLLKPAGDASNVDWLVQGHTTTASFDSDLQNDATAVAQGNVYSLAAETVPGGGKIIVAGTTFFSDFETAVQDNAYANSLITDNIITWLTQEAPAELKSIAAVRQDADQDGVPDLSGRKFAVEGYVTAQSKAVGTNTAFFDVIYVQDDTGGITVFGVSTKPIALGSKVRITGRVGQYQGDTQLQIANEDSDVQILDSTPHTVTPKVLTTAAAMDESNEGWLVKVKGTVTEVGTANGDNSLYLDDGSGTARVFVDGYVGDGTDNPALLGKWDSRIKVGDLVEATGLASQESNGHRLRVRNTAEIVRLDTIPPEITISGIEDGAEYFLNQNVPVTWTATDDDSGIDSVEAGVPSGSSIDTGTSGPKVFSITATDKAGNKSTKEIRYNVVLVSLTGPADNLQTTQPWISVTGKAVMGASVTVNNTAVVPDDNGNFSTPVLLQQGTNRIMVTARDAAGNSTTLTRTVLKPVVVLFNPPDGWYTNCQTVNVMGYAAPESTVTVNGQTVLLDPWGTFRIPLSLTEGSNTITVIGTDKYGYTTTLTRTVVYDATPPSLTVTSPADNLKTSEALLNVYGTSEPGAKVFVNGCQAGVDDSGNFSYDIGLDRGVNSVTVLAIDRAGNSTSLTRTVFLAGAAASTTSKNNMLKNM